MKKVLFTTLVLLAFDASANHGPGEFPPAPHPAQLGAAAMQARNSSDSSSHQEAPALNPHHHEHAGATGPEVIELQCVQTLGGEGAWWKDRTSIAVRLLRPSDASLTQMQFKNMWRRFVRLIDQSKLDVNDLLTTSFVDLYGDVVRTMFEHKGEDIRMNSELKHRLSRPKSVRLFRNLFYTSEYLDRYIKAAHVKLQRNQYAHEQLQKLERPTFFQRRLLNHLNDEIQALRNELEQLNEPVEEFDGRSFSADLARHVERFLIAYKKLGLPPPVSWEEAWAPHYGRLTEEDLGPFSETRSQSH